MVQLRCGIRIPITVEIACQNPGQAALWEAADPLLATPSWRIALETKPLLKGLLTFLPGIDLLPRQKATGGTDTADYCYGVWLKHLTLLFQNGMKTIPNTIAEIGPGDSLGTGLAAILSGATSYYALDMVRYSNIDRNIKIFDELVQLFKNRAPRPRQGWPDFDMYLDERLFPSTILHEAILEKSLADDRIKRIRHAVMNPEFQDDIVIKYIVPWSDSSIIQKKTIDLIFSHTVLQHVVDLESIYQAMSVWLKPNGMMSHQIDLTSMGSSTKWNGHWAYPETLWKIIVGKRPYLINRLPSSVHRNLVEKNGLDVICAIMRRRTDGIKRSELASRWHAMSDDALTCSNLFLQAKKRECVK